jgi:hypothetical protein
MNKRVLTAALTAERLSVSTRTIRRWAADGFFPGAYTLNPALRDSPLIIPVEDVEAFEQKRREYQPATAESEWSFSWWPLLDVLSMYTTLQETPITSGWLLTTFQP